MAATCKVCCESLKRTKHGLNHVNGSGKFNPAAELSLLPFIFSSESIYICRPCKQLLMKRATLRTNLSELDGTLRKFQSTIRARPVIPSSSSLSDSTTSLSLGSPTSSEVSSILSPSKFSSLRIISPLGSPINFSLSPPSTSPIAKKVKLTDASVQTNATYPIKSSTSTTAFISVKWPTLERHKELSNDLTNIGVKLLKGTYPEIAKAVWAHAEINKSLIGLFLKEINKECDYMCQEKTNKGKSEPQSRSIKSILKKTSKDDLLNFSFEQLDAEMQFRCPIFRSVLLTSSLRTNKTTSTDLFWQSTISTAAAVCLKNRSSKMTALQLIISNILQHSSFTVSY